MKKILPLLLFYIVLACTKANDEPIVPLLPAGQIDIINNTDYAVTINTVDGAKDFKPVRLTAKSTITVDMLTQLNFNVKITIGAESSKSDWRYRFKEGFANSKSTYSLDFAEYSVEYVVEGTMADAIIQYHNDKNGQDKFDKLKLPFKIQYKNFQNTIASLGAYSNYKDGTIKGKIYFFGKLVQQAESTGNYPNFGLVYADF